MDLVYDCAAALEMVKSPCKGENYGHPVMFIIGHPEGSLTVAGESPTVSEIQTGISALVLDKLIVIEQVTNASRVSREIEEESGADTADGLREVFGELIETAGSIKFLDEALRDDFAMLALLKRLQVWTITSGGYIFGGKTGYKTSNYIGPLLMEGFGTRAAMPFSFVHKHKMNETDPAGFDDAFLDLTNA